MLPGSQLAQLSGFSSCLRAEGVRGCRCQSVPCRDDDDDEVQMALVVKNLPANAGDLRDGSLIPGWGRSPGGRNGNPLQYS